MSITGDGIPSNTTINEINNTNKSITLSNSITSSDLSVNTSITLTIISTGTITGYNKSSRSIQVCLSNTNHILDSNTYYKISPNVSLQENTVLHDNYYKRESENINESK